MISMNFPKVSHPSNELIINDALRCSGTAAKFTTKVSPDFAKVLSCQHFDIGYCILHVMISLC